MKTFLFVILFFSCLAHGGDGRVVGNGGDVIVCYGADKEISEIHLLDYYEAFVLRGLDLDLGADLLSPLAKVKLVLSRLQRLSPLRSERYLNHLETFFNEALIKSGIVLTDIYDAGTIVLPSANCEIKQIANQSTPLLPFDKRYLIDKNLWDLLDNNQKAGLILHEIVYREALEYGHLNSISTRYLNGLLSSTYLNQLERQEFIDVLYQLDFDNIQIQKANLMLKKIINERVIDTRPLFHSNGSLKFGHIREGSSFNILGNSLELRQTIEFFPNGMVQALYPNRVGPVIFFDLVFVAAPQKIQFHLHGAVKKILIESPLMFNFENLKIETIGQLEFFENHQLKFAELEQGEWQVNGASTPIKRIIEFHPTGAVKKVDLIKPTYFTFANGGFLFRDGLEFHPNGQLHKGSGNSLTEIIKLQGKKILFSTFNPFLFYSDGSLKAGNIAEKVRLKLSNGHSQYFLPPAKIFFTRKGLVQI